MAFVLVAGAVLDAIMLTDLVYGLAGEEAPSDKLLNAADKYFDSDEGKKMAATCPLMAGGYGLTKILCYERDVQNGLIDWLLGKKTKDAKPQQEPEQEAQLTPEEREKQKMVIVLANARHRLEKIDKIDAAWHIWLHAHEDDKEKYGPMHSDDGHDNPDALIFDQILARLLSAAENRRSKVAPKLPVVEQHIDSTPWISNFDQAVTDHLSRYYKISDTIQKYDNLKRAGLSPQLDELQEATKDQFQVIVQDFQPRPIIVKDFSQFAPKVDAKPVWKIPDFGELPGIFMNPIMGDPPPASGGGKGKGQPSGNDDPGILSGVIDVFTGGGGGHKGKGGGAFGVSIN